MELLKQFYNERVFCLGLPGFEELTEEEVNELKNTFSFAIYRFHISIQEFKKALLKTINLK